MPAWRVGCSGLGSLSAPEPIIRDLLSADDYRAAADDLSQRARAAIAARVRDDFERMATAWLRLAIRLEALGASEHRPDGYRKLASRAWITRPKFPIGHR